MEKEKAPNKEVSSKTRCLLWARAAGHCQYPNCNKDLIGDAVSLTPRLMAALVAHIVAAESSGPRGDPVRSALLADAIENLMLLCHEHHRLIDIERPDDHPEELLLAFKAAHEERIRIQTNIKEDRSTHILRYAARIGANEAAVALARVQTAVLPDYYPATFGSIDLELVGCKYEDHEREYWVFQQENLRRQFASSISGKIEHEKIGHLSVFALAPQPLLIELGRLLCDIVPAELYQLHREPKTWSWLTDGPEVQLDVGRPTSVNGTPVLKLALSATINDERIHAVLGDDVSIWSLSARSPGNDIVRRKEDLGRFRTQMRALFDEIKSAHGEHTMINVFPAMPVSAAVDVGRVWMPKADLPLVVFDQNRTVGGFMRTLDIKPESL